MIISEVLDAIDNISSITIESEISMCESLLSSYDKMSIIEENYNGNDINDFKIFQEGFGDDVKDEMKKSGKNMGTLMKILTALPRFIIAIVKSIKNQLTKKTKDNAKEINDNVKKLSDEQKKGLAQLFPKDRKGKIDAKKIITGMIGGAAVVGGAIAIGKYKIPKKLAEQTKHVLGKLKGKKSNNPKPANKKTQNNTAENDNKLTNTERNSENDKELKELYDRVSKELNNVIKISDDDIKQIINAFSIINNLKSGEDSAWPDNDKYDAVIKNIIKNNKNIVETLKTKEVEHLIKDFANNWKKYETYGIYGKADIIAGNILNIIKDSVPVPNDGKKKIEIADELYNEINDTLDDISKACRKYINDSKKNYSFFSVYYLYSKGVCVSATIMGEWFNNFVVAKYYLTNESSSEFSRRREELSEEIKKNFEIKEFDYTTEYKGEHTGIPIDTFVSELNSYIEKTLDPSKINKQIDDIMKDCKSINKDTCDVVAVTSSLKNVKNEILCISDIINKINKVITKVNEFIKKINERDDVNIVTTDKKLKQVDTSAIKFEDT